MRATVLTPEVAGGRGDLAEIEIEVSNTLDVVDNIALEVRGVDPRALSSDVPSVSLFPGEEATIRLTLDVPEALPAGINELIIDVVSVIRPDLNQQCTVIVDVEPMHRAELKLTPEIVRAKSKGTVQAAYRNTGNTVLEVSVLARDDERHLRFDVTPSSMVVPPGTVAFVDIDAKGRRPFLGAAAYRNVYVNADSEAGLLDDTVSFVQRPWIPRGVLTAALLSLIVGLWALIFSEGLKLVLKEDPNGKGAPETFVMPRSYAALLNPDFVAIDQTGPTNASASRPRAGSAAEDDFDLNAKLAELTQEERTALTAVFASVTARVVGDQSGEAIPRVAVEAHRKRPGKDPGSVETLTQVSTTDLQGDVRLTGLLPGTYYLRFTGPGIPEQWYDGDGAVSALPVALRLRSGDNTALERIEIAGELGEINGVVHTGDLVTQVEVVVRRYISEIPQQETGADDVYRRGTFASRDDDGDGIADGPIEYSFASLETPLAYHLTFRTDRFQEQVIIEGVDPGEVLEARPVRLAPGDGTITGTIVFAGSVPTDPVTVTATDGRETFITSTPPPGPNGFGVTTTTFEFRGLRSPATYQLTFEADGFEDVGAAADVRAGESASITVDMSGQTRRITGLVVDGATKAGLGDVRIEVLRSTGTSVTFSFPGEAGAPVPCPVPAGYSPVGTTSAGPTGQFVLENLELGIHAVTFTRKGWLDVTHQLEVTNDAPPRFLALDPDGGGAIQMTPALGTVCGTVVDNGGAPITNGTVRLQPANGADGANDDLEVPLANQPAGFFKISALAVGDYTLTIVPADTQKYDSCTIRFAVKASTLPTDRVRSIRVTLNPKPAACAAAPGS